MLPKNIEQAKELVITYREVTEEILAQTERDSNPYYPLLTYLTGFGDKTKCTLCAVVRDPMKGTVNCQECIYGYKKKHKGYTYCSGGKFAVSYEVIYEANSYEDIVLACKKRAKVIEKQIKWIEKHEKTN